MGYFIISKETLYIKFDLATQTIVQNDTFYIEKYPEDNSDNGSFSVNYTSTNFSLIADLENENLKVKYADKLIFDYPLKQFRLDKYSKEVQDREATPT